MNETEKTPKSGSRMLGNLLLTLTALIWGTAFVGQRAGMDSIEPITFCASRMWLSAAAVGLVAWLTGRREKTLTDEARAERNRNTLLGGLGCGFFLATATIFQQMGLVTTSAGKAGFITAMYMLLVPIIGFVLLKQRNTWLVWLAVLIGVAGMYLLCITEGFSLTTGDALVCACALLFSGHILCCDHFAPRANPVHMSAIQFLVAAVISTVAAFISEQPSWDKVVSAAVPILYCGLMSGGVGYTLQIVAQRWTDPTVASLLMSLEAVFAALAGAVILGERMTSRELIGCAVMFLAIILVQIPLPRKPSREGEAVPAKGRLG